ncbi:hypothetical protein BC828DRAFT_438746 [Blastocladiella britannica]|nr:hypothetical protein BC828DRAFT_438746 [Blastocladiella britannica]
MPEPIVSSSTKLPAPALLLGTTAHARRTPRSHAFAYPTLYIGVSLDDLASGRAESMAGGGLFTYNGAGVLAIHDRDYLYEDDSASLRSKALRVLHEQAAIESEVIGPVYMVTMPRLLGYAFNPLTMYYCYRASASGTEGDRLRAVILEVNNTFGERHVYVCDPEHNAVRAHGQGQDEETHLGGEQVRGTTKPPVAYTHHFTVHRSFHVSPFNPRTGLYDVATIDPSSTIHGGLAVAIKLAMRAAAVSAVGNLTVRPEALPVTFTADLVLSTARPLSPASIARTLATYPLTLFLTVPRILYQAYLLAFVRNLWVYARPPPLSAAARDDQPSATGMLNTGRAKTIRALRPSPLADAARNIVAGSPLAAWPAAACLARAVPGSPRIGLVMRGADGSVQELAPATGFAGNRGARSVVEVHVRDADAWESLALAQDPVQGFVREYVVGHFDVRWHVSSESVASGARGGEDAGSDSGVDDTTASPVIPLASTTKDDDDSALTAFATMLVAAARRPSPRAFRAGKPVRLARRLARMVAAAAAGRTGPRGGPARDAPLLPAMNGTRAAFQCAHRLAAACPTATVPSGPVVRGTESIGGHVFRENGAVRVVATRGRRAVADVRARGPGGAGGDAADVAAVGIVAAAAAADNDDDRGADGHGGDGADPG